jgi:GT2 family glycosyltransferase
MAHPDNADVGICGIQLVDELGQVARSCARFPSVVNFSVQAVGLSKLRWFHASALHMSDWDHTTTRDVDHVIGAFFLVRRTAFNALSGFDERFFVYLEDLDFSLRARQAGWRSMYLPEAKAFHSGGGTSRHVKAKRLFYSLRSRLLYGFKHFSATEAWWLLFITVALEPCSRLAFALFRGEWRDARHTLQAYGMLTKCLPEVLSTRPR